MKLPFLGRKTRASRTSDGLLGGLVAIVCAFSLGMFTEATQLLGVLPCNAAEVPVFTGKAVLDKVIDAARAGNWSELSVGDIVGKVAPMLAGTPYVGGTLDRCVEREYCNADLTGLDCVTFVESTLAMARMIKSGGTTPEDFIKALTEIRYRGGIAGDYTSRLHYSSDWFNDNNTKAVAKLLEDLPGSKPFKPKVNFMTTHAASYKQLSGNPEYVEKMQGFEAAISKTSLKFVPVADLGKAESALKTGDVVGICTNVPGLDIAHMGFVIRTPDGVVHFMDASSKKASMKVTLEPGALSQTIGANKSWTGAVFARPVDEVE